MRFDQGPLEEAGGCGRGKVRAHTAATGRLAQDRDVARVPAEGADVALYPAQRGLLVGNAEVAGPGTRSIQGGVGEEAQRAERVKYFIQ